MLDDNDWLKTIKQGDMVFYEGGGFVHRVIQPRAVKRVTKTQIVVDDIKFRIDTGRAVGGYTSHYLLPYNDKNKHAYTIQEKRREVNRQWKELQNLIKVQYLPEGKLAAVSGSMEQLKMLLG